MFSVRKLLAWALILHYLRLSVVEGQYPTDPQPLSLHVLDMETGGTAANVTCRLYRRVGNEFQFLSQQVTDVDGRIAEFLPVANFQQGVYRIWCDIKEYFDHQNMPTFFPAMQVTFRLQDPHKDYHVVILQSQYGFTTYRGT